MFNIIKLTNLDLLQTDKLWEAFIPFDHSKFPPLNSRFEAAAYDSSNFLVGLGPALFIFVAINILYGISFLIKCCIPKQQVGIDRVD